MTVSHSDRTPTAPRIHIRLPRRTTTLDPTSCATTHPETDRSVPWTTTMTTAATASPTALSSSSSSLSSISMLQHWNNHDTFSFPVNDECTALTFVPSGRLIVAGFADGTVRLFDVVSSSNGTTGLRRRPTSRPGTTVASDTDQEEHEFSMDDDEDDATSASSPWTDGPPIAAVGLHNGNGDDSGDDGGGSSRSRSRSAATSVVTNSTASSPAGRSRASHNSNDHEALGAAAPPLRRPRGRPRTTAPPRPSSSSSCSSTTPSMVSSNQRRRGVVLSKDHVRHGAVACQIHAKGVHTSLRLHVAVSPDGRYAFGGVLRGSMELVAVRLDSVERAQQALLSMSSMSSSVASHSPLATDTLLDLVSVDRHSDAKLRGFGACTQVGTASSSSTSLQYLLFTGCGIKNMHIWSFVVHPHRVDPVWTCLYDCPTNGNTITHLSFRHHGGDGPNHQPQSLQALSKSDGQKLRVWTLPDDLMPDTNQHPPHHHQHHHHHTSSPSATTPASHRRRRPDFTDIVHTEAALGVAGEFALCGGDSLVHQLSIVNLDLAHQSVYHHTELPLPSTEGRSTASTTTDTTTTSCSSHHRRRRRRPQRGALTCVERVATATATPLSSNAPTNSTATAMLELSNGTVALFRPGRATLEAVPDIPIRPAGTSRTVCVGRLGPDQWWVTAWAVYDPVTGRGHIRTRVVDERWGVPQPSAGEVVEAVGDAGVRPTPEPDNSQPDLPRKKKRTERKTPKVEATKSKKRDVSVRSVKRVAHESKVVSEKSEQTIKDQPNSKSPGSTMNRNQESTACGTTVVKESAKRIKKKHTVDRGSASTKKQSKETVATPAPKSNTAVRSAASLSRNVVTTTKKKRETPQLTTGRRMPNTHIVSTAKKAPPSVKESTITPNVNGAARLNRSTLSKQVPWTVEKKTSHLDPTVTPKYPVANRTKQPSSMEPLARRLTSTMPLQKIETASFRRTEIDESSNDMDRASSTSTDKPLTETLLAKRTGARSDECTPRLQRHHQGVSHEIAHSSVQEQREIMQDAALLISTKFTSSSQTSLKRPPQQLDHLATHQSVKKCKGMTSLDYTVPRRKSTVSEGSVGSRRPSDASNGSAAIRRLSNASHGSTASRRPSDASKGSTACRRPSDASQGFATANKVTSKDTAASNRRRPTPGPLAESRVATKSPGLRKDSPEMRTLIRSACAQKLDRLQELLDDSVARRNVWAKPVAESNCQTMAVQHRAEHEQLRTQVLLTTKNTVRSILDAPTVSSLTMAGQFFETVLDSYKDQTETLLLRQELEAQTLCSMAQRDHDVRHENRQVDFAFPLIFEQAKACLPTVDELREAT